MPELMEFYNQKNYFVRFPPLQSKASWKPVIDPQYKMYCNALWKRFSWVALAFFALFRWWFTFNKAAIFLQCFVLMWDSCTPAAQRNLRRT